MSNLLDHYRNILAGYKTAVVDDVKEKLFGKNAYTQSTQSNPETEDKPKNIGGYTKDDAIGEIYVAWTFDDGPTYGLSKQIHDFFASKNIFAITWFLVKARFDNWSSQSNQKENMTHLIKMLKDWQEKGNEIGIHTAQENQGAWFPDSKEASGGSHKSIKEATDAIKAFNENYLSKNKLNVTYLRPPYGLYTELVNYLTKLGYTGNTGDIVRKILSGDILSHTDVNIKKLITDMEHLGKFLTDNNFEIGIGIRETVAGRINMTRMTYTKEKKISDEKYVKIYGTQDWNIESANNQPSTNPVLVDEFKVDINNIKSENEDSLISEYVILCHDTQTEKYISAMKKDFDKMESLALHNKVKIVYVTMTELYSTK